MGLISESNDPEHALHTKTASFHTIMNRDATTTGPQTNSTASTTEPNASTFKMNELVSKEKCTENNNDQALNTSARTD